MEPKRRSKGKRCKKGKNIEAKCEIGEELLEEMIARRARTWRKRDG